MIFQRKIVRKLVKKKINFESNKNLYNQLTKKIRFELKSIKDNDWKQFMEKLGSNPVNTKPFWNKINTIRGKTIKNDIPVLIHEDKKFINDDEKANLFAHLLKTTFTDSNNDNFDNNFKNSIDSKLITKNFKTHEFNNINVFVKEDLEKVIKKLKTKSTPGKDKINNMMLFNTSSEFRDIILHLINLTVKRSEIPQRIWAEIK